MTKRLDKADAAMVRQYRDADGSMNWGSLGRGDMAFWSTLADTWPMRVLLAIGVGGLIALLVWLFA